ncbi:hypothetical protein B0H13DRAFT_1853971 [Mycena leptocephala]|nr:hypothetical protein B0H13DRAFT_1853971 [Mycena leptocephala]
MSRQPGPASFSQSGPQQSGLPAYPGSASEQPAPSTYPGSASEQPQPAPSTYPESAPGQPEPAVEPQESQPAPEAPADPEPDTDSGNQWECIDCERRIQKYTLLNLRLLRKSYVRCFNISRLRTEITTHRDKKRWTVPVDKRAYGQPYAAVIFRRRHQVYGFFLSRVLGFQGNDKTWGRKFTEDDKRCSARTRRNKSANAAERTLWSGSSQNGADNPLSHLHILRRLPQSANFIFLLGGIIIPVVASFN